MCPECETEHNLVGVAGLGRQKNHRKITDEHFCSDEASVNCLSFSGPVLCPFGRPVLDNSNGDLLWHILYSGVEGHVYYSSGRPTEDLHQHYHTNVDGGSLQTLAGTWIGLAAHCSSLNRLWR